MKEKELREIANYLKNSIIKPYLIHIEFEVLNTLTNLTMDKMIKKLYELKGFNWNYLIETTKQFLYRIRNLIKALQI